MRKDKNVFLTNIMEFCRDHGMILWKGYMKVKRFEGVDRNYGDDPDEVIDLMGIKQE